MAERWLKYTCPICHRAYAQTRHYRAHLVTPHVPCPLGCGLAFVRVAQHMFRWHRARLHHDGRIEGVAPSILVGRPDGYVVALPTIIHGQVPR